MNFATCHNNGSYALWDAKQQLNIVETEKIPYGPYPCTPMTKICVKITRKYVVSFFDNSFKHFI
jgi:hypothetical protein